MKNAIKSLIKQIVSEEIAGLRGNYFWGKDRNGGNTNPPEYFEHEPDSVTLVKKLQQLDPQIKLSSLYKDFVKQVQLTDPEDESSVYALYHNFLRTFGLSRDNFQAGKDIDGEAAYAVYDFFKDQSQHNSELRARFDTYGK